MSIHCHLDDNSFNEPGEGMLWNTHLAIHNYGHIMLFRMTRHLKSNNKLKMIEFRADLKNAKTMIFMLENFVREQTAAK